VTAGQALAPDPLAPARTGSALSLGSSVLPPGGTSELSRPDTDVLLFVADGRGTLRLDGQAHALAPGTAALVLAGEAAAVTADGGLRLLHAAIGREAERHAPLGDRAVTVQEDAVESSGATGRRSFQLLFGPDNGCDRATLFLGYVPPGRAPWHYHLYDEIVVIRSGLARVHRADGTTEEAPAGTAFRLAPREVHIVENAGDGELALLGLFTPAGSPSAAYLPAEAATTQP
jgi:quercetin dioxygenase-like cupin family protein